MTRLARLVDDSDPSETVMLLGGEHGLVSLHLSLCGVPQAMVVHSPVARPGWTGPEPCHRLEMTCWCLSSVMGKRLLWAMEYARDTTGEEPLWDLMEKSYRLYLEEAR